MIERAVYVGLALVLGWVAYLCADSAHSNYLALGADGAAAGALTVVARALLLALAALVGACAGLASVFFLFIAWALDAPGDSLNDPHWCELLFRDHPKRELRAWARSMRYFRFIRGPGGGMADHGDRLALALRAESQAELSRIFAALGVSATPIWPDAASGGHVAFSANPPGEPIAPTPESTAAGRVRIAEVWVDAWMSGTALELSLADPDRPGEVGAMSVEDARRVEERIERVADCVIDPPQDDRHCVCPKYYPSFWAEPDNRVSASMAGMAAERDGVRNRALPFGMAGAVLVLFSAMAWSEIGGTPLLHSEPLTRIVAALHSLGGTWLAVGAFLLPGIALLLKSRSAAVARTPAPEAGRKRQRGAQADAQTVPPRPAREGPPPTGEKIIYVILALATAGMSVMFALGTRDSYADHERYRDFERWSVSPGVLESLTLRQVSNKSALPYRIDCPYRFTVAGAPVAGTVFDARDVLYNSADEAKAHVQSVLGRIDAARWRPVQRGNTFTDWVLDTAGLAVTVRHSPRDPAASSLSALAPAPEAFAWVVIVLQALGALLTGIACPAMIAAMFLKQRLPQEVATAGEDDPRA